MSTSQILYRLSSRTTPDVLRFEGSSLRLSEVKKRILGQANLSEEKEDSDLLVTDTSTNRVLDKEDELVSRNTALEVRRIPAGTKVYHIEKLKRNRISEQREQKEAASLRILKAKQTPVLDDLGGDIYLYNFKPMAEDEDNGLLQIEQVTQYAQGLRGPSRRINRVKRTGFPGADQNRLNQRNNVGIPRVFMEDVEDNLSQNDKEEKKDDQDDFFFEAGMEDEDANKGKKNTAWGNLGKEDGDVELKGRSTIMSEEELREKIKSENIEVPKTLKCALTQELLKDAVTLSCCYQVCSNDPLVEELVASNFDCPLCGDKQTLDQLKPNEAIREQVETFLKQKRDEFSGKKKPEEQNVTEQKVENGAGGMQMGLPGPGPVNEMGGRNGMNTFNQPMYYNQGFNGNYQGVPPYHMNNPHMGQMPMPYGQPMMGNGMQFRGNFPPGGFPMNGQMGFGPRPGMMPRPMMMGPGMNMHPGQQQNFQQAPNGQHQKKSEKSDGDKGEKRLKTKSSRDERSGRDRGSKRSRSRSRSRRDRRKRSRSRDRDRHRERDRERDRRHEKHRERSHKSGSDERDRKRDSKKSSHSSGHDSRSKAKEEMRRIQQEKDRRDKEKKSSSSSSKHKSSSSSRHRSEKNEGSTGRRDRSRERERTNKSKSKESGHSGSRKRSRERSTKEHSDSRTKRRKDDHSNKDSARKSSSRSDSKKDSRKR
eukprot:maker-scaffold_6-snap-gene-16.22-mRNA-1 protein AED:0.00 eAED:0.00 QI:94/1/1/1/0.5/0.33/3/66/704